MASSPEKSEIGTVCSTALATDECKICLDSFETLKKRKRVVVNLDCGHVYCRVCLRKHALASLNNWKAPKCPDPCCSSSSLAPIQGILPEKKIRIMEKAKHDILKGRRQCPILNCVGDVGLFHDKLRCMKCQTEICSACEREKLIDHTCQKDDLLSITKSRDCRRCPSCRAPFVKISGCPSMRCQVCRNTFTYTDQHVVTGVDDTPSPVSSSSSTMPAELRVASDMFTCSMCSLFCISDLSFPHCCLCLTLYFDHDVYEICDLCMYKAQRENFFDNGFSEFY